MWRGSPHDGLSYNKITIIADFQKKHTAFHTSNLRNGSSSKSTEDIDKVTMHPFLSYDE